MTWTHERTEQLKKLWDDGLSANVIAARLGGLTRNAVLGKVDRLGLPRRKTTIKRARCGAECIVREPRRRRGRRSRRNRPYLRSAPLPGPTQFCPPPEERIPLADMTRTTCRWPVGMPGEPDFGFCGRQCSADEPYCEQHAAIAHGRTIPVEAAS